MIIQVIEKVYSTLYYSSKQISQDRDGIVATVRHVIDKSTSNDKM